MRVEPGPTLAASHFQQSRQQIHQADKALAAAEPTMRILM
jgi:hypothetical protein